MKTLAILNPYAGSRTLSRFDGLKKELRVLYDDLRVVITLRPEEVAMHLHHAADDGYDTVLGLGGDGTNHSILNVLMADKLPMTLATLPLGTGRDLARVLGIPLRTDDALKWLAKATPHKIDIGEVTIGTDVRYFMNVASVGLSGEVGQRVNRVAEKRPWTFFQATLTTLLLMSPPRIQVRLDGKEWFEGESFLLAVGNGRYFGRGMKVCPNAYLNDGYFDVVLVEWMPKQEVIAALPSIYNGTHIRREDVYQVRAQSVEVQAVVPPLGVELDGEPTEAGSVFFTIRPQAISVLLNPATAALVPDTKSLPA